MLERHVLLPEAAKRVYNQSVLRMCLLNWSRSPHRLDLNSARVHNYRQAHVYSYHWGRVHSYHQARVECQPPVISCHAFRAADCVLADSPA